MTVETPGSSRPEMHWSRWGDPAAATPLAEPARALVDAFLGTRETPSVASDEVRLSDPLAAELVDSLGAVVGPWLLDSLRVHDRRVRGLAKGAVSHGVGTSRSLHDHATEGAFAGLAMGLTALLTSVLVPLVIALL